MAGNHWTVAHSWTVSAKVATGHACPMGHSAALVRLQTLPASHRLATAELSGLMVPRGHSWPLAHSVHAPELHCSPPWHGHAASHASPISPEPEHPIPMPICATSSSTISFRAVLTETGVAIGMLMIANTRRPVAAITLLLQHPRPSPLSTLESSYRQRWGHRS